MSQLVRFSWLRLEWFHDITDIDLLLLIIVHSTSGTLLSLTFVFRSEHKALHTNRLDDRC